MTKLDEVKGWVVEHLPALLEQYDVPAAAVGILAEGQVVDHAAGLLSRSTRVEATADSVFQIGSITKLWTSTLVMQLVDEGAVDLDAPLRSYLPEFRIADEGAARQITVRQLLTHTAGFEGDIFTDTGVGDDAVEKYLGVLHEVPQLFAPGELWSYNNAGFVLLGRLVEVLRGTPYDVCASACSLRWASRTRPPAPTRRSCSGPRSGTSRPSAAGATTPLPPGRSCVRTRRPGRCSR